MKLYFLCAAAPAFALAACGDRQADDQTSEIATVPSTSETTASGASAVAMLKTADGKSVGEAKVTEAANGLELTLNVNGLPPGNHGVHIHTTGRCDAPDFKSAGGHWNPTNKEHGLANEAGHHLGDFVNLEVVSDGTGHLERPIEGATLSSGSNALLDSDGAAFIIHAGNDDQMTDPAGDSGERIACGVFTKSG